MGSARRSLAFATVALALGGTTACGGDDVFPRDEFVRQVQANGVTAPVAECTYDRVESNDLIMRELIRADGPNPKISEAASDQLSKILARCLLAAEDGKGPDSPTTTRKK